MKASIHKVIITGTGRAGTTFLVRLFTELGLDTGYTPENWQRDYFAHCNAGLEHKLSDPQAPYIVKDPDLCTTLSQVLSDDSLAIDHAIIPVRDLDAAANSRIRVGGSDGSVPGGLRHTSNPAQQKAILAEMFHQLAVTLAAHDIPHTYLLFPRFVQDADYAYSKLKVLLDGISQEQFSEAFRRVAEPSLVHTFTADKPAPVCDVGSFQKAQRQKRLWRRTRRLAAWSAVAASFAWNIGSHWTAPVVSPVGISQPMTFALNDGSGPQGIRIATNPTQQSGPLSVVPGRVGSYRTWTPFVVTTPASSTPLLSDDSSRSPNVLASSISEASKNEHNPSLGHVE